MIDNQYFIERYKEIVEKQLGWGNGEQWQTQDFENLSDRIFEKTNVVLSISTLKRIWGRVQYHGKPNLSTLDILARFVGFNNWRSFMASEMVAQEVKEEDTQIVVEKGKLPKWILLLFVIICSVVLIRFIVLHHNRMSLRLNDVTFSSKPVTIGVPNTVVFEYNAIHSNADSVFIQQSWDPKRRFKVDKGLQTYASTYYKPGYYRAKLILNDSIVREHDVFVESNGWMGYMEHNPAPIYLKEEVFKVDKMIGIGEGQLDELKLSDKDPLFLTLANVNRNLNLSSDHFQLDIGLQNTYSGNGSPCLLTTLDVLGTDGVFAIPFSRIGCSGELNMLLGTKNIDGKTHDLSAFGVDFSHMVQVHCETKLKNISISINGHIVFEDRIERGIGKIVGVRIRFNGIGFIKDFSLKNNE